MQDLNAIRLKIDGYKAKVKTASDLYVINGTRGEPRGFQRLIDLMDQSGLSFYETDDAGRAKRKGLIAVNDVILIKINAQWDQRGGTNTDLIKTLITVILDHPDGFHGEIVIADNGQGRGSMDWEHNNAEDPSQSIQSVVNAFSDSMISTYLWDNIREITVKEYSNNDLNDGYVVNQVSNQTTGINVSYPKFRTSFGTYLSFKNGIWNQKIKNYDDQRLKIFNIPVLKSHRLYGATACVKHYMGVVSRHLTNAHESVGTGGMGTEMVETRMPTFNLIDAIWINATPGNGPGTTYSEAVNTNLIAGSIDPVALDYWAAKHVLLKTAQLRKHQLPLLMDPDNESDSSFGKWLRLSMHEINKSGYHTTMDEEQMNVYVANIKKTASISS
ncbi:MAG: DUF362 domain-containing protein [Candidatus Bathyarchaeota archaeon]|nr:MAG: DUF362 domain-containing protein [Candidatus Bathyarchaeota archaeon]